MNLYRGFAYQKGRLHRALGYCLSYRGTCTRHALYNKARVAVTADYSHYPPTVIRIQTITESGRIRSPCTTNILNDVGLARDTGADYQHSLQRYKRHFV